MSTFDATGGPWGYRLRHSPLQRGIDAYFEAGTFTGQTEPELQGTIGDPTIYAGAGAGGETFLLRHNWYNQCGHYLATRANYPAYPRVTVVDYANLYTLSDILPGLAVQPGGVVDLAVLLRLAANREIMANVGTRFALLALISGCAVTDPQRRQLAAALALDANAAEILMTHGVLLHGLTETFTPQDCSIISATLALFPEPVKDQVHLIVLDRGLSVGGGYRSGGIISLRDHAGGPASFAPYPGGRQIPDLADFLQSILVHEIGHLCDSASVGLEERRYLDIFNRAFIHPDGSPDPDTFLYGLRYGIPVPTEDIIFFFLGYCTDSATILDEVRSRENTILSQKLSHAIDLLPSEVPGMVPYFTTNRDTGLTRASLVPATRAPGTALGDDGMIRSVNGREF